MQLAFGCLLLYTKKYFIWTKSISGIYLIAAPYPKTSMYTYIVLKAEKIGVIISVVRTYTLNEASRGALVE